MPASGHSPYTDITEKFGIKIDFKPFITVEPVSAREFRSQKINILDYTAVVFSSKKGADHYFRMCKELRVSVPDTMKYFCLSQQIALYLQKNIQYRRRKIFYSETGKLEGLTESFNKHINEKFLVVMPEQHKDDVTELLTELNASYKVAIMYRTVSVDFGHSAKLDYDMLVFFSPLGVASLFKNFPDFKQGEVQIACFGADTAKAVEAAGLRLDLCVTPTSDPPSMPLALYQYVKGLVGKKK